MNRMIKEIHEGELWRLMETKRVVLCVGLLLCVLPGKFFAEPIQYSDSSISFEYDDSALSWIEFSESEGMVDYYAYTQMNQDEASTMAYISVRDIEQYADDWEIDADDWKEYLFGESTEEYPEIVQEMPEYNGVMKRRLIYYSDKQFGIVTEYAFDASREDAAKTSDLIYKTAKMEGDVQFPGPDVIHNSENIFVNVIISDQAQKYLEETIKILYDVLDLKISEDEAATKIAEIVSQSEEALFSSIYSNDAAIWYKLSVCAAALGNDEKVMSTIADLEGFLQNK